MDIPWIERKTLLNRSLVEWTDYNCNHYVGCAHGCLYPCYAQKGSHKKYLDWCRPAYVVNALELAVKEIKRVPPGARIMVSSMTDPYQPIEEKLHITRSLIPVLAIKRWEGIPEPQNVVLITKSDLVMRDFDLIKQFPNVSLCMTVTSINDLEHYEPFAPGNQRRIKCLLAGHHKGIHTIASVEPWIPEETKIMQLLHRLVPFVDEFFIGSWNHKFKRGSPRQKEVIKHYRCYLPVVEEFLKNHMKKYLVKKELRMHAKTPTSMSNQRSGCQTQKS